MTTYWCDTEVVFIGKNTKKLYDDWQKADKKINEGDQHWLGRLFLYKCVSKKYRPFCRSFIENIHITSKNTLLMSTLDAWKPMIDAYNKIADMYNLNFVVKAEEPGHEIYINTDITGKYFPERYIFKFYCNSDLPWNFLVDKLKSLDTQMYFSNFTQISEVLSEYGVNDEQDMEYFCEYIRNKYPDYMINFHKYKEEL